ncbi:MAG: prepilin-type N-terminal cleavage/methylation domain-containing protein [Bacilli bacterium]|nr:prepilin-type N-terminal cleavage/methylation domain-containing protein [Bacilli bacterium]
MKNRKAFTIVELLAVIVILAIILIIAVPQIMNAIKIAKLKSIEGSARLIAKNAEEDYYSQKLINKRYNATSIPCSDVAKLSDDYSSCSITYDNSGTATVTLKGASGGKFDKIKCTGTKANINCSEITPLPGYTDAVELLTSKIGTGGLIKDDHDELRYQGETVDNYVTFNDEVAKWRIVGLFNVDGEQRVKLVRKDSIWNNYSWDTSDSSVNRGEGINQWGPSGTYEGADLMRELNGDYLNSTLSVDANWYDGSNNSLGSENFDKNYVLKESAQELIGDATWFLGGVAYNSTVTLADAYIQERGEQGKMCTQGATYCNDTVTRTYTWTGKVGLIYSSDYGYASGNSNCATNIASYNPYCDTNWMGDYGWTISPQRDSSSAFYVWNADSLMYGVEASVPCPVHPSVYLISGVQMKGSGTTADPYVFAE